MSQQQLEFLNKEEEALEQKILSVLLQLGVQYKEDKIGELREVLVKRIKVKNSFRPFKKMLEKEGQSEELLELLTQTKAVLYQIQQKVEIESKLKQENQKEKQACENKFKLIQEIQRKIKQISDIEVQNEKFEHYFKYIRESMQEKMKLSFQEDAKTLESIHRQIRSQEETIVKEIGTIESQNKQLLKLIEQQKREGDGFRAQEVQLNGKIQGLKAQNEMKKLFRDREKSRRQMELLSNSNSEQGNYFQEKSSSFEPESVERIAVLPINEWKRVSPYVIPFGIWTTLLAGYYIYSVL